MSITREDVADLREGDVVELTDERWPEGTVLRGPAYFSDGELRVGHLALATRDGRLYLDRPRTSLTVVSRAPRPPYVNHPRTEPVPGDIVNFRSRSTGSTIGPFLYTYVERWAGDPDAGGLTRWVGLPGCHPDTGPIHNAGKLRLLVDGETGQVVP